jgi:hypothetical protein
MLLTKSVTYIFIGRGSFTVPRPNHKSGVPRDYLVLLRTSLVATTFSASVKRHKAGDACMLSRGHLDQT